MATPTAAAFPVALERLEAALEHWHGGRIDGDWPTPWRGVEYRGDGGVLRCWTDDNEIEVVAFDPRGVETSRARFSEFFPAALLAGVVEGLLVAIAGDV